MAWLWQFAKNIVMGDGSTCMRNLPCDDPMLLYYLRPVTTITVTFFLRKVFPPSAPSGSRF